MGPLLAIDLGIKTGLARSGWKAAGTVFSETRYGEAILIGFWAVPDVGWLKERPRDLRR